MLEKEILAVINRNYPNSVGAIITGSQLQNNKINLKHDIDIIIIDESFSVASSLIITVNGLIFDFTQIPLNDLDNILWNEFFDPQGILLQMIVKGRIIKGADNIIIDRLKSTANNLYEQLNPLNYEAFQKCIKDLYNLKKDFLKEQEYFRNFFLLNDFISIISNAELIKLSKWNNLGKHKADFLYQNNLLFVNKLTKICYSLLNQPEKKALTVIAPFIDNYVNAPFNLKIDIHLGQIVIIDFWYEGISIENFILKILPIVKTDTCIGSSYQYFYLTPKRYHRIYKYYLCIAFSTEENENTIDLYEYFKILLEKNQEKIIVSKTPSYALIKNPFKDFLPCFNPVAIQISKMIESRMTVETNLDNEKSVFTGIIILGYIKKKIDINIEDLIKINFYLCRKFLFSRSEQDKFKLPNDYFFYSKAEYENFNNYYFNNKTFIDQAINKDILITSINSNKIYSKVLFELEILIINNKLIFDKYNSIIYTVLEHEYKIVDLQKSILFVLLYQNIAPVLLLNTKQAALCFYIFTKSIKNYKKE